MPYTDKSLDDKIKKWAKGRDAPFSSKHLSHLGNHDAVRQSLSRLTRKQEIRRIQRGLYQVPKTNRLIGELSPEPMSVIKALMEGSQSRWQVSGAYATNMLGISEQVPAKIVILTDGIARKVDLGKQQIVFRRASPRNLLGAGTQAGLVFQALRYLGSKGVNKDHVAELKNKIDTQTKKQLKKLKSNMPRWMLPIIEEIT